MTEQIDSQRLPRHVAVIMDGNGRWAKQRGLQRTEGHVKGVETVDSETLQPVAQHFERADACVVPNVGVIAENILAYVIANQMTEQKLI